MSTLLRLVILSLFLNFSVYAATTTTTKPIQTGDPCPVGSGKHCSKAYPTCCAEETGVIFCAKTVKGCKLRNDKK